MHAAIVTAPRSRPTYATFADPVAGAGEALVTMKAAALTHLTKGRASGEHYSSGGAYPFVAGVDGVGVTEDGQRVYVILPRAPFGAMGERTAAPTDHLAPVPDDLDDVTAAALANPGMSSWAALTSRARLQPGETVLVNGATGSSGRLAVAIARHLGAARIIATGRNQAVLDQLGADRTISLTQSPDDLNRAFASAIDEGVDVVLDYLWGQSARDLLIAAARTLPDGKPLRFVQIGAMTGGEIALPAQVLRAASIALMGSGLGSVSQPDLLRSIRDLLAAAAPAGLTLPVRTMPLSDVAAAWATDESERIVLTI